MAFSAQQLRDRGTLLVAASGNQSDSTGIGAPACIDGVMAVASSTKEDTYASHANSNSIVDLVAPGYLIDSTYFNGSIITDWVGTSFATPHVAGCAALLVEAGMSDVNALESRLTQSNVQITNPANGLTYPRLDCTIVAPVAHWQMDESNWTGGLNEVADNSGNGYHGSVNNGASTDDTSPAIAGDPGTCDYGLFTQADQRVSIPYQAALNPDDFTVSFWARADNGSGSYRTPINAQWSSNDFSEQRGFGIFVGSNNQWEFWTGGGSGLDILSSSAVANASWAHIAFSFQTTSVNGNVRTGVKTIYVNGAQVAQDATGLYQPNEDNPLLIGSWDVGGASYFFNGAIDEVALHNFAMTTSQIQGIMNGYP